MTSQRVERSWIRTGGYGQFRGEWVKYPKISKNGDPLFFPVMPDTGNVKDCFDLPPTFSIFTLKNVTWWTYVISFTVQYCFLFRFVCIELVSLIWFLQIWVAIYVYGTMINYWSTLIKKLMQTYILIVSGSILNVSIVHLNGIKLLIPHMTYLSKPVLGRHPVLSGHYCIPWGCPLNTDFTCWVSK